MAKATADGPRVRIDASGGTFYVEVWEARKLAAELAAATDNLFDWGTTAAPAAYEQALREHKTWMDQRRAELGIEED